MKFISPKVDYAFKKIFGSQQSQDILISFLNVIIYGGEKVIQFLTIVNPYNPGQAIGETYLDVKAVLADGSLVVIEMQIASMAAFNKRVAYNLAKAQYFSVKILPKGRDRIALFAAVVLREGGECSQYFSVKILPKRRDRMRFLRLLNMSFAISARGALGEITDTARVPRNNLLPSMTAGDCFGGVTLEGFSPNHKIRLKVCCVIIAFRRLQCLKYRCFTCGRALYLQVLGPVEAIGHGSNGVWSKVVDRGWYREYTENSEGTNSVKH